MAPARITIGINALGGACPRPGRERDAARVRRAWQPRARDAARTSRLRLHLSAAAEEIPFARAAITRLCEHLEIGDEVTQRIRLAVTEACANCVEHAYDDAARAATYLLDARLEGRALRVLVSDSGRGIQNHQLHDRSGLGLGLHLIQELADDSDISSRPSGGTRVVMRFELPS